MAQKFQPKKLNKDDHKKVDMAADGLKKGVGALGVLTVIGAGVVKYGKPILKAAKNILIK